MIRSLSPPSARVAEEYAKANPYESEQQVAGLVNKLRTPEGRATLAQQFPNTATRWARAASPSDPAAYAPEDILAHLESQRSAPAGHPALAALPARQPRSVSDALTDETSRPSAHRAVSGFAQASSGNGVMRSDPRRTRQPRVAPYPPQSGTPQSSIAGVTWQASRRWRVRVKCLKTGKRQTVMFEPDDYGGDIERTREAAEQCADEIREGTYVHQPARAEHCSGTTGVRWDKRKKRWLVSFKRPDDPKPRTVTFAAEKYGGDIEQARQAAEECAARIQEGIYVHKPVHRAEYHSEVPGVSWEKGQRRWVVKIRGPHDQEPQIATFLATRYSGDIERAQQAAEECAAQIRAGTYRRQT